jgi:hypothetical protein
MKSMKFVIGELDARNLGLLLLRITTAAKYVTGSRPRSSRMDIKSLFHTTQSVSTMDGSGLLAPSPISRVHQRNNSCRVPMKVPYRYYQ